MRPKLTGYLLAKIDSRTLLEYSHELSCFYDSQQQGSNLKGAVHLIGRIFIGRIIF